MILQQIPPVPKEYVDLLTWIIGISFMVIGVLAGVIVYLHKNSMKDKITIIEHVDKTNNALDNISTYVKESGTTSSSLKDSIKDLNSSIVSHNDYLPKLIRALTGKDI